MSQATRFLHDMWFYFQFLTFKNVKNYPQNSRKKRQTPANPEKSYRHFFLNPPDHIVDCKPYDKCKVTEKFVATPGILNFTRKQEMLEISRKRMLQDIFTYIYIWTIYIINGNIMGKNSPFLINLIHRNDLVGGVEHMVFMTFHILGIIDHPN